MLTINNYLLLSRRCPRIIWLLHVNGNYGEKETCKVIKGINNLSLQSIIEQCQAKNVYFRFHVLIYNQFALDS